jgi:hypothetical protein
MAEHIEPGMHVLVLSEQEFSALNSLLYEVYSYGHEPDRLTKIANDSRMALGSNQIATISRLWGRIHNIKGNG